ncbi:YqzE family protein [Barrientosiimonas marina]|uniref:YqzE family protein n=1 Tax=Lentibacillus kimchii TaxID=1542911 RepID=A0ABW2UW19_9BACI
MSINDYVKYLTQQMTAYLDTPAEEKEKKRSRHTTEASAYSSRWFGVVPFVFKMARKKTN